MTFIALTIAGSDPSGGAGLQADLKTFHQHGVYGTSVVTLLTVQNTTRVSRVDVLDESLVLAQLEAVLEDVPPAAAKTGALGSAALVRAIASQAAAFEFPLVVDPVMISKHGAPLLDEAAQQEMRLLIAQAALVTPNGPEAAALTRRVVESDGDAEAAAHRLIELGASAVLVKGGHLSGEQAVDVLVDATGVYRFSSPRLATDQTHGTGCSYAAAITARLAKGEPLHSAIEGAKKWLSRAIATAPGVGHGQGPINHLTPVE